jgi:hypothetical protein
MLCSNYTGCCDIRVTTDFRTSMTDGDSQQGQKTFRKSSRSTRAPLRYGTPTADATATASVAVASANAKPPSDAPRRGVGRPKKVRAPSMEANSPLHGPPSAPVVEESSRLLPNAPASAAAESQMAQAVNTVTPDSLHAGATPQQSTEPPRTFPRTDLSPVVEESFEESLGRPGNSEGAKSMEELALADHDRPSNSPTEIEALSADPLRVEHQSGRRMEEDIRADEREPGAGSDDDDILAIKPSNVNNSTGTRIRSNGTLQDDEEPLEWLVSHDILVKIMIMHPVTESTKTIKLHGWDLLDWDRKARFSILDKIEIPRKHQNKAQLTCKYINFKASKDNSWQDVEEQAEWDDILTEMGVREKERLAAQQAGKKKIPDSKLPLCFKLTNPVSACSDSKALHKC